MRNGLRQWQMSHQRTVSYTVTECDDLLNPSNPALRSTAPSKTSRRLVVLDETLSPYYLTRIERYFSENHIPFEIISIETGEHHKSINDLLSLLQQIMQFAPARYHEPIIAIGGGVLTDLVGFAASIYRRGIPRINVPTTLMGYIDASIGVKTGINFLQQKNRIGTFLPPKDVLLDKTFLTTLPERHLRNGVGEIVKLAVIKNPLLFELLDNHGQTAIQLAFQDTLSTKILTMAIDDMLAELQPNLFEDNLERLVDFGHTFAYSLEMQPDVDILHGESVAIDIALCSTLSYLRGMLSQHDLHRILNLMMKLNLPIYHTSVKVNDLWEGLNERILHRDGFQRVPLPKSIGQGVFVNNIQKNEIVLAHHFITHWIQKHSAYYFDDF